MRLRLWHWHRWDIRGIEHLYACPPWREPPMGTPVTEVLYVCAECGKARTHAITGHWTVEQLRREK